jgi:MFS family permease
MAFASSLRSIEGGVVMPLVGFFIDRIGVRKCIMIGIVILSISFIMMSRLNSLYTFYASFLVMAIGNTMATGIAQYTAVANWFRRRRSMALGVLSAGFGISGIMTPLLVYLIDTYGWRTALFGLAFSFIIVGIPLALVIRHRPEQYGMLPDGDKPKNEAELEASKKISGQRFSRYTGATEGGMTLKECLRTRNFWMLFLFNGFTSGAQSAINVLAMPNLLNAGIAESIAALTITGITMSSLVGRLGFSALGDTHDKKRLLIVAVALKAVGVFIFANIRSPWMIIPFLAFYGPGFGGPIPLSYAIQADCFGIKEFASIRGIMAISSMTFGIAAPLLAGWFYDTQGSYTIAFVAFSFMVILAIPAIMLVRIPAHEPADLTAAAGATH